MQVTNYKCPACTAPLKFSSETGKLECEYCGSHFTVEEVEAFYAQKNEKAAQDFEKTGAEADAGAAMDAEKAAEFINEEAPQRESQWDDSTISANWGEDSEHMRAYSCPSCGAELMCEASTAATSCPYCGNPTIVPGQFHGSLKPDFIIPFTMNKEATMAALKKHYRKRLFLPGTFSTANQIKKIQGVYVPFWLFDAQTSGDCHFIASNSRTHREGDYKVTRTDYFSVVRGGMIEFGNVPTDASKRMPDDVMDSLEPYDFRQLKPFSMAYLPGYLADRYDVSVKDSEGRADRRCMTTTERIMYSNVVGYQNVRMVRNGMTLQRGRVHYALLPVWLIKTKWNKKDYLFAMNGQTGKFVGNLPVSRGKFWGWCAGLTAACGILAYLLNIGGFFASLFGL